MTDLRARSGAKRVQIEAVVIRADGTREDLGVVSDSAWSKCDPRRWAAARRTRQANARRKT